MTVPDICEGDSVLLRNASDIGRPEQLFNENDFMVGVYNPSIEQTVTDSITSDFKQT